MSRTRKADTKDGLCVYQGSEELVCEYMYQGVVTPICAILRAVTGDTNCDRLHSAVTL